MTYDGKTPSLREAIKIGADRAIERLRISYPYAVKTFNKDTGLASLTPLIRVKNSDGSISDLPVLEEVLVSFPSGGGYHFVFPLVEGDEGTVITSSRSMTQWVESGDPKAEPEGRRVSSLTDATFIPGIKSRKNPRVELQLGVLSLGSDDGDLEVVIQGSPVRIGSTTADDAVAKSVPVTSDLTKVATDLKSIQTALSSHGIPVNITFSGPANNATTKLKAD